MLKCFATQISPNFFFRMYVENDPIEEDALDSMISDTSQKLKDTIDDMMKLKKSYSQLKSRKQDLEIHLYFLKKSYNSKPSEKHNNKRKHMEPDEEYLCTQLCEVRSFDNCVHGKK